MKIVFLEELREKIPNYFRSNVYDEEGNLIELGGLTLKNLIIILKIHKESLFSSSYSLNFVGKIMRKSR